MTLAWPSGSSEVSDSYGARPRFAVMPINNPIVAGIKFVLVQ
jgi:hypothetical protein